MQPESDRRPQQLVPRGVEGDLVDAVAESVVGSKAGRALIRLRAPADRPGRAGERPYLVRAIGGPPATLAIECLDQDAVGGKRVVVFQRRRLVDDLMGGGLGARMLDRGHGTSLSQAARRPRADDVNPTTQEGAKSTLPA
jgi:hypothetical protein